MESIESPIVSVILPCYNYAHFLPEALDSVLAQTYPHWECIIINDGSPDNTEEVALEYCKKDGRIKYFYKENGGHSSARNFGIKASVGKYILPLDADDRISSIYLEKAIEILETETDVKLVTGEVQLFGNTGSRFKMPEFDLRSFLIVNYITISTLFRRSDYDSTKGFDETMLVFEDLDLFISLLENGGTVRELPFTCLFYRKKEVSIYQTGLKDKNQLFKDLLKLYNNHSDTYQKYFNSPIELIQENQKMFQIIKDYSQTNTYRFGVRLKKIKEYFK